MTAAMPDEEGDVEVISEHVKVIALRKDGASNDKWQCEHCGESCMYGMRQSFYHF